MLIDFWPGFCPFKTEEPPGETDDEDDNYASGEEELDEV